MHAVGRSRWCAPGQLVGIGLFSLGIWSLVHLDEYAALTNNDIHVAGR